YQKHYRPKNAVMVVAGNVSLEQVRELSEKWFEPIIKGDKPARNLPTEKPQKKARRTVAERAVPLDAIYISFHMCGKTEADYQTWDLISDVLSAGQSSRLTQRLVKEKRIFTSVNAFVMGERDPSLFTVAGHISQDKTVEEAEAAIWEELELLRYELVGKTELEKVLNQVEANHEFAEMSLLNRAISLAYHELLDGAESINHEMEKYQAVTREDIQRVATESLVKNNSNTLIYKRKS
ncbi:MAG: insulinase family protein, partial [Flavobacteriales bacterium]|nr:insulinase family protein [Flavobacteriales bacterium]